MSYARGAVIPCFLRLSSADGEALRSLSAPKVPVVKLLRHLRYFKPNPHGAFVDDSRYSGFGFDTGPSRVWSGTSVGKTEDFEVVGHELGTARWWVPPDVDVPQDFHVRHLEGELHLRVDLQPNCTSEIFSIEVSGLVSTSRSEHYKFLS